MLDQNAKSIWCSAKYTRHFGKQGIGLGVKHLDPYYQLLRASSQVAVSPRPSTSLGMSRERAEAKGICTQPITPGYQISKKTQVSPATEISIQSEEPSASPPTPLRASEGPEPEGEDLGGRRWRTLTKPRIEVAKVGARTTLKQLLGRSQPSRAIPRLRFR